MISRRIKNSTNAYVESVFSPKVEKKWTFSKLLVLGVCITTILVTIFSCVAMWYFNNIDPLCYLIPAVFAECATVTGFYSYKAKAENEANEKLRENNWMYLQLMVTIGIVYEKLGN